MTATLLTEYIHLRRVLSLSQGSMQILPNTNVLIGYGHNGVFCGFAADGTVVRDTHFEAASAVDTGDVQSCRVLKYPWKGTPRTEPQLRVQVNAAYVSWIGATEVRYCVLEHASQWWAAERGCEEYKRLERKGRETGISFGESVLSRYVRVVGLNEYGNVLCTTKAVDWASPAVSRIPHPYSFTC